MRRRRTRCSTAFTTALAVPAAVFAAITIGFAVFSEAP